MAEVEEKTKNLTEQDLIKIQKKKAKKIAQKLKKKEKKTAVAAAATEAAIVAATNIKGSSSKIKPKDTKEAHNLPTKSNRSKVVHTGKLATVAESKSKAIFQVKSKKNSPQAKLKISASAKLKTKSAVEKFKESLIKVNLKNSGPLLTLKSKEVVKNSESHTGKLNTNETKIKKNKKKATKNANDLNPQVRDPSIEEATIFIGNLPVNTKRVQLIRLLQDYAPVNSIRLRSASGKRLFKHEIRKKAGSLNAYVVLKDAETAERALALNGVEFKGNHLRITHSNMKFSNIDTKRIIFVGNLKYSATENKLREIFSSCGEIDYVRCLYNNENEKGCKGVAYICFKQPDAVGLALELNKTLLDERPIHVERYSTKKISTNESKQKTAIKTKSTSRDAKKLKTNVQSNLRKNDNNKKANNTKSGDKNRESKKSQFRGFKVDTTKNKKAQKSSIHLNLSKKIAPKSLLEAT